MTDSLFQRSMDSVGGPDAKKARWSPTSFVGANGANGLPNSGSNAVRDAFANYGYGPQASVSQAGFNSSPPSGFASAANPLYSTPSLSINTQANANGMPSQMSPNTAGPFTPQSQQSASANGNGYSNFGGYNMLGMGLPAMGMLNGFPYGGQMGNFNQVRHTGHIPSLYMKLNDYRMVHSRAFLH